MLAHFPLGDKSFRHFENFFCWSQVWTSVIRITESGSLILDLWESISSAEFRVKNRISIVILLDLPLKRSSILEPEFRYKNRILRVILVVLPLKRSSIFVPEFSTCKFFMPSYMGLFRPLPVNLYFLASMKQFRVSWIWFFSVGVKYGPLWVELRNLEVYFWPLGVNFKCGTQGQESHINSDIARPATKEKLDSWTWIPHSQNSVKGF